VLPEVPLAMQEGDADHWHARSAAARKCRPRAA
jgi:hypothetical protein